MSARTEASVLLGPPLKGEASPATFDVFHERHRKLRYTMDFNRSKEEVMNGKTFEVKSRVLEAVKLNCWANFRDYYADEKGRPLPQNHLAQALKLDPQRVSEAIAELVGQGFLRLVGRITFLIDDPALERKGEETEKESPDGSENPPPPTKPSREEMAKAEAFWAAHAPERFQLYQKVGQEVREKELAFRQKIEERKQLREQMLEAYRAHQETEGDASGSESPTRPENESPTRPDKPASDYPTRPDNLSDPSGESDDISLLGFKAYKKLASFVDEVVSACEAIDQSSLANLPGDRAQAIRLAARKLSNETQDRHEGILSHFALDLRQIAVRRENKPRGWGILTKVMDVAIDAVKKQSRKKPKNDPASPAEPPIADQIQSLEDLLSTTPNHPQASSWRAQIDALKRKPAESESAVKAMKAGQA